MKTANIRRSSLLVAALAIGFSAAFAACSSEDTNPNPTPVTSSSSSGETTSTTTAGTGGAGGTASTTTTTSTTASGTGGAGGGGDCFGGTPKTNVEFLNACTTADCGKFTTTLPLLKSDGTLPPLP